MFWILPLAIGGAYLLTNKKAQATASQLFGPFIPAGGLPVNNDDLDTLARTLWGEARSEGNVGMHAVANVVMNRYRLAQKNSAYARLWGRTPRAICRMPYQFSCWLPNDPNYRKLISVTASDPDFANALSLAKQALQYRLPDITQGSTFYHTKKVRPKWALNTQPITTIGAHKFYTASQVG